MIADLLVLARALSRTIVYIKFQCIRHLAELALLQLVLHRVLLQHHVDIGVACFTTYRHAIDTAFAQKEQVVVDLADRALSDGKGVVARAAAQESLALNHFHIELITLIATLHEKLAVKLIVIQGQSGCQRLAQVEFHFVGTTIDIIEVDV